MENIIKLKNRKTLSVSRRKIVSAINLFEQYIDEPFENIRIYSGTLYEFKTSYSNYSVDISDNKVKKTYADI